MPDELIQPHSCPERAVSRIVARNVSLLRADRRWTQTELSDRTQVLGVRVAKATLSKMERLSARVDVDQLCVLAEVFGRTPAEMLRPMGVATTGTDLPRYPKED